MIKVLRVLFISSEAAPLVKVGGLGDVSGSLPPALQLTSTDLDVRLVLPFYPEIKQRDWEITPITSFKIAHASGPISADVHQTRINGVTSYLIDGSPVSQSPSVYSGEGYEDGHKFTFLSIAGMKLLKVLNWPPNILHAHDWHASPAVYNLHLIREKDKFFSNTKSLLTIHNLPYLGHGSSTSLKEFGLPKAHKSPLPDWAEHLPLPLGLLTADRINTVSNGYAEEILTPEFGTNLEGFLNTRKEVISGILNGLDQDSWNPEGDPELPVNYSSESLAKRRENKIKLLTELGLEIDPQKPLLAMISRLDHQKGVDLLPGALEMIADLNWQAVILGTGDPKIEFSVQQLEETFPTVRSKIAFDGPLARRIYGGSDIILIPSRYEPCGLTQMIGMRYGCVPLARATGGLKDTIQDYNQAKSDKGTGFLFKEATSTQLSNTIRKALEIYQDQRRWKGIQRRGMRKDFSWKVSAERYLQLYREMV
jgi:starch synthase